MKVIIQSVNEKGLQEIHDFLRNFHKKGNDYFDRSMLRAWAEDAEFQLSEGNSATIEISEYDSTSGATVRFEISDAGLDSEEIEIDEDSDD